MVFSSLYLDPHINNWYQQENPQQLISIINENPQQLQPPPAGSSRAGPTAEQARLAKTAYPETPLKCPRCDSTNTKFCYFNNYSLSQPRHFCKTCRRYWTRGGTLRNVPVGGGCRRNKRINKKSSKSPKAIPSSSRGSENMLNHVLSAAQSSQLPFLPSMHVLGGYSSSDIGLSFGTEPGIVATGSFGTLISNSIGSNLGHHIGMSSSGISEQWRMQQFPFLANFETSVTMPSGLQGVELDHQLRASSKQLDDINGISTKMEGNQSLNLSKNLTGNTENDQYWGGGGNAWSTDVSGFSSAASTRHLL